jgi:hypothetical protein
MLKYTSKIVSAMGTTGDLCQSRTVKDCHTLVLSQKSQEDLKCWHENVANNSPHIEYAGLAKLLESDQCVDANNNQYK